MSKIMDLNLRQKLKIISRNEEPFMDRDEAGALLAELLNHFKGPKTVVLGIPRGGLVVARQISQSLQAPLDIVLTRKLGAPQNPELAIGAITEGGEVFWDKQLADVMSEEYRQAEKERQLIEIKRRRNVFRAVRPKINLKNKDVIVVDDGIATGATVKAALWSVSQEGPNKVIGAFPVGAEGALLNLCESAEEIICLKVPPFLQSVSRFYFDFSEVSEDQVIQILKN